jgi:uncharacterized repeat protein (TIGR01451 family)
VLTRVVQRKRPRRPAFLFLTVGLAASLLVSSVALALITDGPGTFDITVPDSSESETADLGNATVEYIGSDADNSSSGTGLFDPFVRLQGSPTEEGYNTNGPVQFQTKAGKWTKAVLASAIPQVDCRGDLAGTDCWELFVDINEGNNAKYVSLNEVEVWLTDNPNIGGYPNGGFTTAEKVYDFSGNILIHDVNEGSGRGDLLYLIPVQEYEEGDWFVLYSKWGTTAGTAPDGKSWSSEGGFEEWKVRKAPNVSIVKTANPAGPVSAGATIGFDITISNTGAADATAVTISDPLPAGGNWSLNPSFTGCSITGAVGSQVLNCSFTTLASGGSIGPIHVQSATTADDCGTINNTATVSVGGTAVDDDDASVVVQCGAVKITKTAKHFDSSGDTSADLVATFTIVDSAGNSHQVTTNASGVGCVGGVTLGMTQSITESTVPDGYAAPTISNVNVVSGTCSGTTLTGGVNVPVENTPLTDVSISIDSQHDGATSTVIECWGPDSDPATDPADWSTTVSDGSLSIDDLAPTDPAVTLNCQITIDP